MSAATIDIATMLVQIERTPDIDRLRALTPNFAQADPATVESILNEGARFCAAWLAPLNPQADRVGCSLANGRVSTPPGFIAAWQAYVAAGWPTLDHPADEGGQGLPLFLSSSVQQMVDSSCAAFGMLPVLQRSAARLLAAFGNEAMRAEWLPRLVRGEWAASICISEAEAGSDAARVRTRAEAQPDGGWSITGEKMWISFGDHDLTPQIGHCVLARTAVGLSLFLVPSNIPGEAGDIVRNAIVVRRIEEKLGLHGSPTCALGFEGATGWLIGTEGRGLSQLFVMITNMRLSAGMQGLGLAALSTTVALDYANERRQGGPPDAPPLAIVQHADVQRQLFGMVARVEVLRGLGLAIAVQADLAQHETNSNARQRAASLTQWLLPIFKTTGGEYGFDVASDAVQVLGGAGYTSDWPIEQALRDARIAAIYEGTTGMQALDLLHRRIWRDGGTGLAAFLDVARADLDRCSEADRRSAALCYDRLEDAGRHLAALEADPRAAEGGATAFLHLAGLAATGWIATRLAVLDDLDAASRRLAAAAGYWLTDLHERAAPLHGQVVRGATPLAAFGEL